MVKVGSKALQSQSVSLSGWGVFGFLELVVLLVAGGVLVLLFERAEGSKFQLPGGDGAAILTTGCVTCVLIIWGMFDRPGTSGQGPYATATGLDWGIFIVLAVAGPLTYAGSRIRTAPLTDRPAASPSATTPPARPPSGPTPPAGPTATADQTPPPRRRARPPRPVSAGTTSPATAAGATKTKGKAQSPPPPPDDATRISNRAGASYDRPTPVSNPKPIKDDTPTRVSNRRPSTTDDTAEPTQIFGPPVVPDEPPTLKISRRRPPTPTDPPKKRNGQ